MLYEEMPPITFIKRNGGTVLLRNGHQYILKENIRTARRHGNALTEKK